MTINPTTLMVPQTDQILQKSSWMMTQINNITASSIYCDFKVPRLNSLILHPESIHIWFCFTWNFRRDFDPIRNILANPSSCHRSKTTPLTHTGRGSKMAAKGILTAKNSGFNIEEQRHREGKVGLLIAIRVPNSSSVPVENCLVWKLSSTNLSNSSQRQQFLTNNNEISCELPSYRPNLPQKCNTRQNERLVDFSLKWEGRVIKILDQNCVVVFSL